MSKYTIIDFYEYSPKDMCVYIKKVKLNKELTEEEQTILSLRNALALQEHSKNHFIRWWKMSKTEYAWAIQRDDGSIYFDCPDESFSDFYNRDEWTRFYDKNISLYKSKDVAMKAIKDCHLQNCQPVRVKIEIVGEDDE